VLDLIVEMFSISQGYGFCSGSGYSKVFFRVEDFHKLHYSEPQPVLGERVLASQIKEVGKNPKAFEVKRVQAPILLEATVQSFDAVKGWGFANCYLGTYFIHKSDFIDSFVPIIGGKVAFYSGKKKGKNRGCYIIRSDK